MNQSMDIIGCQGLDYECLIGFHEYELHSTQKITIDLIAYVDKNFTLKNEDANQIQFDYFIANQSIKTFIQGKQFKLIETLGQEIAKLLLEKFSIPKIKVKVTKYPLDMPNLRAVFYECERGLE